ncbi:MAG: hypothetical protein RIE58_07865 [Vicingaceae bacterium]
MNNFKRKTLASIIRGLFQLLVVGMPMYSFGQNDSLVFKYPEELTYKAGIIKTVPGEIYKVKAISLIKANNRLQASYKNQNLNFGLLELDQIKVQTGNKALIWALILGTAGTWFGHEIVKNGGSSNAYMIGAVGAGLGVVIGIGRKNYKTIYEDGYFISR